MVRLQSMTLATVLGPNRALELLTGLVTSTDPDATSPPIPPAAIVTYADTPADVPTETSVQTDWPDPAPPGGTTTASLNRDYNFFDELDARLADLQNPADGSED